MNDQQKPPGSARRLVRAVLIAIGLLMGLVVGSCLYMWYAGKNRLAAARAEADRLDPGWRFEELHARRRSIPSEQNSAVVAQDILALFPVVWPSSPLVRRKGAHETAPGEDIKFWDRLAELDSVYQLTEDQLLNLEAELELLGGIRERLRGLADVPHGRFEIPLDEDYPSRIGIQSGGLRKLLRALQYDSMVRGQRKDGDGAIVSCQAMVNVARSIGDEPAMLPHLVRAACTAGSLRALERVLAQSNPSVEKLTALQRLLEEDLHEPVLLHAVRGERAFLEWSDYDYGGAIGSLPGGVRMAMAAGLHEESCGQLLEKLNEAVENAKLPVGKQLDAYRELEDSVKRLKGNSHLTAIRSVHLLMMMPSVVKLAEAIHRGRAQVSCAILALAAERYRIARGRWPATPEELQPFIKKMPVDPFTGESLRLIRTDHGVIIYSVGEDRTDDGGKQATGQAPGKGSDLPFRLWDPGQRRQQPPASAQREAQPGGGDQE